MKKVLNILMFVVIMFILSSCSVIKNHFHNEVFISLERKGWYGELPQDNIVIINKRRIIKDTVKLENAIYLSRWFMNYLVSNKTINLLLDDLKSYPLNDCPYRNLNHEYFNYNIVVYKNKKICQCFYLKNYNESIEFFKKLASDIEKNNCDEKLESILKGWVNNMKNEYDRIQKEKK